MKSAISPENLEKLFLFEVYVETLNIDYPKLCFTQNCLNTLKETIIQFQFLGFQPVEIREDEFTGKEEGCGLRKVNAGKSCLFSLRDLPRQVRYMEIDVKVMRRTTEDSLFTIAVSSIKLGDQFADILKSSKNKKNSTSLKKSFKLFDSRCREVGMMDVNISLSCFGKIITTSFQLDGEDSKAYVVQPGGEVPISDFLQSESSIDKGICPGRYGIDPSYRNVIRGPTYQINRPMGGLLGGYGPPPQINARYGFPQPMSAGYGPQPIMNAGYGFQQPMNAGYGFRQPMNAGYGPQPMMNAGFGYQQPMNAGFTPRPPINAGFGPQPPVLFKNQGQWQGQGLLGGNMNAFDRKARDKSSDTSSSDETPPPPPPPFQVCSCDYPLPPGFPPPPPPKKKKKKKKKFDCPLSLMKDFCMNPQCPKGYPTLPVFEERQQICQAMEVPAGAIGMKGEQMMFQLPGDNQPLPGNKKARLNFGGLNNNFKDVRIMNDGETKKFSVPNKANDIYVIKVGKTNQETDQRQKVVLELKQPRKPVDERAFYERRTQYLEADFMAEQPKKKKKKEKKGKKGKKGKGKKGKKKEKKGKKGKKGKGKKGKKK